MEGLAWFSISISFACIMMVTLSWWIAEWIWLKPKRLEKCFREQGFKCNPYRILYGDTKERANMVFEARSKPMPQLCHDYLPRVLPFLHHTVKNYGQRSLIWNGPVPMINITKVDLMKEVFMKINDFHKPKSNPILYKVATGLVQLEGDEWARHRKLINPAFHMEKIKGMLPAFWASSYEMINNWEEKTLEKGWCEVEVWSHLHKLAADGISRAAFGSSYEEGRRIFELISEQIRVSVPLLSSVYIPGWRFIPTSANRSIEKTDREIRTLLMGIISKRKKAIKEGDKPKDDLLGVLLQPSSQENNKQVIYEHKNELSLEEVINECKIFYLAGQETTSILLVWTLVLLGKYQEWQSRAREEVLTIFGNNMPDFHRLNNHLKTMNMILQEVLRLYPPVREVSRTVCEDIKVGDIFLPKGVQVNLPILLVQQDEKLWGDDAKEFKPERFVEGVSKATSGSVSFFSFGWGPRICIGSNFAMTEAKMALAMILQHFAFELSPSYAHAPDPIGSLRPQYGAPIIFRRL